MRATLYASLTVCLWLVFRAAAIDGMNPDSNFLIKVPNPPGPAPLASAASLSIVNAQKTDASGLENLALRPQAKASASGTLPGHAIHRVEHLNDGLLGNEHSWIADGPAGWAEIDLGGDFHICRIALGSDSSGIRRDRAPTAFTLQVTSATGADATWETVYAYAGEPVCVRTVFTFRPVQARRVRVTIQSANSGQPRLDEIEVFGSPDKIPETKVGALSPNAQFTDGLHNYDAQLRRAILGEEHAWLKAYGYADIEYRLRVSNVNYPEHRFPSHVEDDVLPLPTLATIPKLDGQADDPAWEGASKGMARVCQIADWEAGPLVEQAVEAGVCSNDLYLAVTADRFLSAHLALVGVINQPTRGLIVLTREGLKWQPLDPEGRPTNAVSALPGAYDAARLRFETRLPLAWLPDSGKCGLYVGAGLGGRWTQPSGRPVNFFPAPFALRQTTGRGDGTFTVRVTLASPDTGITLDSAAAGTRTRLVGSGVQAAVRRDLQVNPRQGPVGPEARLDLSDSRGNAWSLTLFRYAPFQHALTLYGELIDRRAEAGQDVAAERTRLAAFLKSKAGLLKAEPPDRAAERTLLWDVCVAKRALFLRDKGLAPVTKLLFSKRNPFHPSHNYSVQFDSPWRPGGGVYSLAIPLENGALAPEKAQMSCLFDAGDGVVRDPSLSFDATKFYYGYRPAFTNYYRIYEQDVATGTRHQISDNGPFHDFWPTPLPDGGLAFITTRCKKKFICWRPQAAVLYRMETDGSRVEPLSYANLTEFAPSVLDDGRILWTRSEYVDKGADYGHTLWTIRADGTLPELTYGNTLALPNGFANGRQMPGAGTREVCAIMISHFGDLNGPVALLDLAKGPHDPSAISNLTPEIPWPGYSPNSEAFREPLPVTRDVILVAHAPQDRFGLYLLDRYGNRELLYTDPSIDSVCPLFFRPRPVPPVMHGAIVPALASLNKGQLSVENVYRGLEGQVRPGAAKYLRICQELPTDLRQMPDGSYQADHTPYHQWYASPVDLLYAPFGWPSYVAKGVIGTVPVEADGSANFLAPAGRVLYLELLDDNYNEIQRMRSVVQLRPGERRSCIGCHESRLITPDQSYLKMQAMKKAPAEPVPPPWGAGPFWFERVVQPVLDARCVSCHNAKTPNKIDLSDTRDKESVPVSYHNLIFSSTVHYFNYLYQAGVPYKAAPYTFGTVKSRLWTILKDKNHASVKLTPHEEQAIKCWTDLNVPLWGDYAFRPERLTVRPQDKDRWRPD